MFDLNYYFSTITEKFGEINIPDLESYEIEPSGPLIEIGIPHDDNNEAIINVVSFFIMIDPLRCAPPDVHDDERL